jgi:hypothetical protein
VIEVLEFIFEEHFWGSLFWIIIVSLCIEGIVKAGRKND